MITKADHREVDFEPGIWMEMSQDRIQLGAFGVSDDGPFDFDTKQLIVYCFIAVSRLKSN
jgi:hypothetical protein